MKWAILTIAIFLLAFFGSHTYRCNVTNLSSPLGAWFCIKMKKDADTIRFMSDDQKKQYAKDHGFEYDR